MNDEELIERLRDALVAAGRGDQITLADIKLDCKAAAALPGLPSQMEQIAHDVQEVRVILIGTPDDPEGLVHIVKKHAFFWQVIAWVAGVTATGLIGWLLKAALGA